MILSKKQHLNTQALMDGFGGLCFFDFFCIVLYTPTTHDAVSRPEVKCVIPDRELFFREVAEESWVMGALDPRT